MSFFELTKISKHLDRPTRFSFAEFGNIPRSRNAVMNAVRDGLQEDDHYMLWWDTDIIIPPGSAEQIADMIKWADGQPEDVAVTANYRMFNGQSVLMRSRVPGKGTHYTDEELEKMPNFSEIGMSGFGLIYLPIDSDYVWHADTHGEDIHYWWEHPNLPLYLDKRIDLLHQKTIRV